ncbi:plexin-A4-like [Contarinia nasturtii]|uniref:plexin-A4-like n=1 Tax=Contarinia nasturtii TaxID=265458 RepID=UPI0012D3FE62|nr:plexin-A4-like [Contarinia nasturtii]
MASNRWSKKGVSFSLIIHFVSTLIILNQLIFVKGEEIMHEFKTNLTHLVVNHETGDVFIGGHNRLFKLFPNLTIDEKSSNCSRGDATINHLNVNKVLLIDYERKHLIVCGTMKQSCSTRDLNNICNESKRHENIVAENENESTVAFIAPDLSSIDALYLGVTINLQKNQMYSVSSVSSRRLNETINPDNMFGHVKLERDDGTLVVIDKSISPYYNINYVYGFSSQGFSYFLTIQPKNANASPNEYITKLVRVCQNDPYFNCLIHTRKFQLNALAMV